MLTPNEAYAIAEKKFPGLTKKTWSDYGSFYSFDRIEPLAYESDGYKIDKSTGNISSFDLLEEIEMSKKGITPIRITIE